MKKIIQILITIILFTFTACSSDANVTSQRIEVKTNNTPITKPSKSETRYTLMESEESDYELVATLTQTELKKIVPNDYKNYNHIRISGVDDGVIYISTEKANSEDVFTQDIFAYYPQDNTISHLADISGLKSWLMMIFEVDSNLFFYTENSSSRKIYLYNNNKLTLLADEFYYPIETPNGIAISPSDTGSIVEFKGTSQTTITPELFPSILYTYDPIRYVSLSNGQILLCTIENNKMTSILDLPEYDLALFSDYFWVEHEDETNILSMYNYNNEEMISFEDKPSTYTGQTNDNTMFRIDLDDNIWIYKCDEENKTVTKSMLEDSKARTRNVFSDDNYVIRCYPNSYELFDHAYDVYREK